MNNKTKNILEKFFSFKVDVALTKIDYKLNPPTKHKQSFSFRTPTKREILAGEIDF